MRREEKFELDKICAYCERATVLAGGEHVLCERKGVVSEGYHCRKFVYDPVKRIPKRAKPLPEVEFEPEETAKSVEETSDEIKEEANTEVATDADISDIAEDVDTDAEARECDEPQSELPKIDLPKIDDII